VDRLQNARQQGFPVFKIVTSAVTVSEDVRFIRPVSIAS
jgi:hypothetical protein